MKIVHHKKQANKQLLLLFNGWGFDGRIFSDVNIPDYDIISVYDYSETDPQQLNFTNDYESVNLMAWSYGVFIANIYAEYIHNLKKAIAVNGTITPVDDTNGIPKDVFIATLHNLNEKSRDKFYLRIAGGLTAFKAIKDKLPERSVENQLNELENLYKLSLVEYTGGINWDKAILSQNDKIFPYNNMLNAWGDKAITIDGEHYVDFNFIIKSYLV